MPLKLNQFTEQTNQYKVSYTPYQLPDNSELAETIDGMISYNLVPKDSSTRVEYFIGARDTFESQLIIKNITKNANIIVEILYDKRLFLVSAVGLEKDDVVKENIIAGRISLSPAETKTVNLSINKDELNSSVVYQIDSNIKLIPKYSSTGEFVLRDTNVARVSQALFPDNIDIR